MQQIFSKIICERIKMKGIARGFRDVVLVLHVLISKTDNKKNMALM